MSKLKLEILTPNGVIYNGEALSVTLPGEEGEFGVLAEHSSLITLLEAGVIDIEKEDKSVESVLINWGVVEVDEKKVIVLVEGAVAIRGDSESAVAKALNDAKELIESIKDNNPAIATVTARLESAAQNLL
ncbi:H+-transporting two-sector ATPase, delta/epsilon subunit [Sulfurimonas denitrificans DSM 1251]|uniref:ATP synthase epsilon chain n=1 Tax=Sulfurimonas denitrificans (strain ATCC 33889 / DSM 1251) TaxID=326298 RepID=ATPE_SULDN|nr:ATP synthase F1 subunit epsilon [Sulfurimonas denitrificans]Q30QQ2.1 RecName: Full=ATP synthase epsilon chain; AltName: Full=ATP synthase F1 sector epsilon subunit; AltName: Full=F-ATPase epsilon subunit [Sulfurimonas denitrificans DSM 1251]ABB44679.1 H+-transporting two-sector ATPase, delta/epsilon subunit [Sulfurimonas denitrificans DSM 1251]MDD3442843.1 ATP synthase F1 subunit epsilon [Sulfurimonas denitrificans]